MGFFYNNFVPRPITFEPPKREQADYDSMLEHTLTMLEKAKGRDEDEDEDVDDSVEKEGADDNASQHRKSDADLPRSHIIPRHRK